MPPTAPGRANSPCFPVSERVQTSKRVEIPPQHGTAQNRPVHAEKQAYFPLRNEREQIAPALVMSQEIQ